LFPNKRFQGNLTIKKKISGGIVVFTCEGQANMLIQHADLLHCAIVLELKDRLLLDSQNHNIGTADTDLKSPFHSNRKSKELGETCS